MSARWRNVLMMFSLWSASCDELHDLLSLFLVLHRLPASFPLPGERSGQNNYTCDQQRGDHASRCEQEFIPDHNF
jgi:hypothetical protein